jgi:hypothetical protein
MGHAERQEGEVNQDDRSYKDPLQHIRDGIFPQIQSKSFGNLTV